MECETKSEYSKKIYNKKNVKPEENGGEKINEIEGKEQLLQIKENRVEEKEIKDEFKKEKVKIEGEDIKEVRTEVVVETETKENVMKETEEENERKIEEKIHYPSYEDFLAEEKLEEEIEEEKKQEEKKREEKEKQVKEEADSSFLDDAFAAFMGEVDSMEKNAQEIRRIRSANVGNNSSIFSSSSVSSTSSSGIANIQLGSAESQCVRLTAQIFATPFQVLLLSSEASDDDIKKQYRKISLLIHPDKCKHPKAHEAFQALTKAYAELQKPEQRNRYKVVIEEAKKRVLKEKQNENKKRRKMKVELLSEKEEDLSDDIVQMCEKMLAEQQERRAYAEKCKAANELYEKLQEEKQRKEELDKLEERMEWEKHRNTRVNSWKDYQGKVLDKKVKVNAFQGIKLKKETREETEKKNQVSGVDNSYKELWR